MKWEWQKIVIYEEMRWDNNNEDEWGDLEGQQKPTKQEWKHDGGLFSDTIEH